MNLSIELTPAEEAQLSAAAERTGLAPAELVKKLVKEHLPTVPGADEYERDAGLSGWQSQEGAKLIPGASTRSLFAQWAIEDSQLTEEERLENERIYAEIEKNGIPRVQI